ncbi:actin-domain-containing protein [Roridomyces roridus]|uniref:Actin-like protein ARP6 n=1 Tax=Roridomyces roridus TaxID=1738132 RepID=A0AAD7BLT6_9AGAR|nr:actin-domain-containing protein [Roridomyces roridus]
MVLLVLENGACSTKAGIVDHPTALEPRIVTNAVVRSKGDKATYVGHEFDRCKDYSSLSYRLPLEKGYVVDWDAQKAVWDGILSEEVLNVNPTESTVLITEPYFNLPKIQEVYDEFIFEEYEFSSQYRAPPASLIPHGSLFNHPGLPTPECMLIVDSGFSFTHVVPLMEGKIVWHAVKRLDVGGKLLTNQLKELVSFRQWNMMEETYIMNHVKETCCFVSQNFGEDLERSRKSPKDNPIVQEYVLPDLTKSNAGRIRQPEDIPLDGDQVLTMGNERFSVPELIFHPDDIGLEQSGLPATIAASIALLPDDLQGMFYANIGLIGGNTKFPGFRERLLSELAALAPVGCDVVIYQSPTDPALSAYHAAIGLASNPDFQVHVALTRAEYMENGTSAVRRKFPGWQQYQYKQQQQQQPRRTQEAPVKAAVKEKQKAAAGSGAGGKAKGKGKQREEGSSKKATASASATSKTTNTAAATAATAPASSNNAKAASGSDSGPSTRTRSGARRLTPVVEVPPRTW